MFQFGVVQFIPVDVGTVALLIILLIVLSFESFTAYLEDIKETDPMIYVIIQRVYKELTILGLIVFLLELYEAHKPRSADERDYRAAIDYVHVLLFFMALAFVIHSCVFVTGSIFLCKEDMEFHKTPLEKVLDNIHSMSTLSRCLYRHEMVPGSKVREIVEFKMLHILFKKTYNFDNTFDFSLYIKKCFQEQVLSLLEQRFHIWVGLFITAILNLIRVKVTQVAEYPCAKPRLLETDDPLNCSDYDATTFLVGGLLLCLFATFLGALSRMYEIRMVRMVGADSVLDYEAMLQYEIVKPMQRLAEHLSVADIKARVRSIAKKGAVVPRQSSAFATNHDGLPSSDPFDSSLRPMEAAIPKSPSNKSTDSVIPISTSEMQPKDDGYKFSSTHLRKIRSSKASLEQCKSNDQLKLNIDQVFWFGRRFLFFWALEMTLMLNCLYISVWLTDFVSVTGTYSWKWQIILVLPFLYNLVCIGFIIKKSSKMNALHKLNSNIIGEMLEAEEENLKLMDDLRQKILSRVRDIGTDSATRQQVVRELFDEIDMNKDGEVTMKELRIFLSVIQLHYSDAKLQRLYRFIDSDDSGSLTIGEISELIFPSESDVPEHGDDGGEQAGYEGGGNGGGGDIEMNDANEDDKINDGAADMRFSTFENARTDEDAPPQFSI